MATPAQVITPAQLLTPTAEILKGFLFQARLKRHVARPALDTAIHFVSALINATSTTEIVSNPHIRPQLMAAAGFSQKSLNHFSAQPEILNRELRLFLYDVEARRGQDWQREVVYRYLFTQGDTIGGAMRNLIGKRAKRKLGRSLWSGLRTLHPTASKTVVTDEIKMISWPDRILWFDKKTPLIRKNVDLILLRQPARLTHAEDYLACGELKGGIDPAGADEHWKTALSALDRIRVQNAPQLRLFFVGAVIDNTLAEDIFARLQSGTLDRVANLTIRGQLGELTNWIGQL